jgi:P-type E1-E2 ATPase
VKTVAFDKTGTLTFGSPGVERVESIGDRPASEILAYAAAAEAYSGHTVAQAIAAAVTGSPDVTDVEETIAQGLSARVDGTRVVVGKAAYVAAASEPFDEPATAAGEMTVWVALDGRAAGRIVLRDELRPDARTTIESLRELGVERFAILSGDSHATVRLVAAQVGIEDVHAGLLPTEKVEAVSRMIPKPVMMVGDGVNDAPVLAVADVGVAMGARGATAAAESADVVILLDRLDRVVHGVSTAKRSVRIALQSIAIGISLSLILMVIAAFGVIPAIVGALLQEAVDLASILNSLRATRAAPGPKGRKALGASGSQAHTGLT